MTRLSQGRTSEQIRAHNAIAKAVTKGIMLKAKSLKCFDCSNQASEYDHFKGYEKEFVLIVQPVCHSCHGLRMTTRKERVMPKGSKHWAFKHGMSQPANKSRKQLKRKHVLYLREYHKKYMQNYRRRNS